MTSERKCFTFLWKLENTSYCVQKFGEEILSPAFVVDAIESTKWRLKLYPRGHRRYSFRVNNIGYFLHRERDSSGNDEVKIKFKLNFIGKDGSNLTSHNVCEKKFSKGASFYELTEINIEDAFVAKKSVFFPNGTLTLRCRMWKGEGEMTEDVKCTALTRIGVENRTLKWDVKNFSSMELEEKLNLQIKSVKNDSRLMSVDLSLTGELNSEVIEFEMSLRDHTIKFVTLQLFLLNYSGKRVKCNHQNIWFDHPTSSKKLTFTLTKNNLLERKDAYLPNDTLSLIWEWVFSKGIVSEGPEEDEQRCICSEINISDAQNSSDDLKTLLNHYVDNVKCLYDEGFLSDVKLKTATSEFPAHKFTLSVSSPVFKSMFSCDMKEKINDCVHIEDMDDDTVRRMLLFIYTTRVNDLTFKSAVKLYEAADKYDITSLKKVCSSYLKDHLSLGNACDILLFSDSHADVELKSDVQDYILKNGKQITKSEEWKALMKANFELAAETLSQLFK